MLFLVFKFNNIDYLFESNLFFLLFNWTSEFNLEFKSYFLDKKFVMSNR